MQCWRLRSHKWKTQAQLSKLISNQQSLRCSQPMFDRRRGSNSSSRTHWRCWSSPWSTATVSFQINYKLQALFDKALTSTSWCAWSGASKLWSLACSNSRRCSAAQSISAHRWTRAHKTCRNGTLRCWKPVRRLPSWTRHAFFNF